MKKFITLSLLIATFAFSATFASAQSYNPQRGYNQNQRDNRWNNRRNNRVRTVTQTRIVRQRNRVFRETIRITYLPNGRTRTQVIRRVRIR